jgi:signal transduction histidine kinase
VDIEVANGRVSLVADTSGPVAPAPSEPGYGLVGMRERASALGGELTAGPTREGWRVRCRLPLEGSE